MPKFTLLTLISKQPTVLIPFAPAIILPSLVVDFTSMYIVLCWFFFADLVTGIGASYCVWKKSDKKDKWFFGKGEGFSSSKAKAMGVKMAVYIFVPLGLIRLQDILCLKTFKYETLSHAEFEIATISVILFCLVEGFSIFHENLPKCGFDLWGSISKIIDFVKKIKNKIKSI